MALLNCDGDSVGGCTSHCERHGHSASLRSVRGHLHSYLIESDISWRCTRESQYSVCPPNGHLRSVRGLRRRIGWKVTGLESSLERAEPGAIDHECFTSLGRSRGRDQAQVRRVKDQSCPGPLCIHCENRRRGGRKIHYLARAGRKVSLHLNCHRPGCQI